MLGDFRFHLSPVEVLELPGQRRVKFFNTRPLPLVSLVCVAFGLFWLLSVLLALLWFSLFWLILTFETDWSA